MPPRKSVAAASSSEPKTFKTGDIVLGRLKGYPKWPSSICDPEEVPPKVRAARTSKAPNVHCVRFFPVGDYAWLHVRDIEHLPPHQIAAWLQEEHRSKDTEIKKAYTIAHDPRVWYAEQSANLADEQEGVDELEDEEGDEEEDSKAGAKRKKAGNGAKAPSKKAKTEVKQKSSSKPQTAKRSTKQPPSSKQDAKAVQPENQAPADDDSFASDPVCIKVKDWRHKLQRTFLSKAPPAEADMNAQDELFKAIEAYDKITVDALQYSKIGKVMKKICTLDNIPRNDELKITERARKLMEGWSEVISKHESANGHANGDGDAPASASEKKEDKPVSAAKPASSAKAAPASASASETKKEEAAPEAKAEAGAEVPAPTAEAEASEKKEEANGDAPKAEPEAAAEPVAEAAAEPVAEAAA